MKMRKMKKRENKIVRGIKTLVQGIVGTSLIIGILTLLGMSVEWICADKGRFILAIFIFSYILYRIYKNEFED